MPQLTDFLPTTKKEMELRGWSEVDIILFSGDAYVDHPSFGAGARSRLPASVWLSFRSPTGTATSAISASWAVHGCSSALLRGAWTQW